MLTGTLLVLIGVVTSVSAVPLSEFFPFGSSANDTVFPPNDDGSTDALPLDVVFPYFDNNHRSIYLANNGLFSFLGPISQFVPTPFPLSDGRRVVAAFWTDIDTRGNITEGNQVFYQVYQPGSESAVFRKASTYVQQYFPGERVFNPTMVITGTWYRVGAFPSQTSRMNTFQIVLVTDERRSFAFLLYHDIQWTHPTYSSNASVPNGTDAQAGFNAGDGVVFQMLPYSRTSVVHLLVNTSNVNVPGLFIFRIDKDVIAPDRCGNSSSLAFRPRRGSQLGSTALTIQGPCFTNRSPGQIRCRFGDSTVVNATAIDELRAICLTPAAPLPSTVLVYLSTDAGNTFQILPSTFTYTPAEYGLSSIDNPQVLILNHVSLFTTAGEQLTLGWYLSEDTINNWLNNSVRLEVHMYRVILNGSNGGIVQSGSVILRTNITWTIGYQLTAVTVPSLDGVALSTIFFRIVARDVIANVIYGGLNSVLLTLRDTRLSPSGYCQSWAAEQPLPSVWNDDLLPCPMTLAQARVARCCYEPDPLCTDGAYDSLFNCQLRRGRPAYNEESAVACYLSRQSSRHNAGGECCYDSTGQLITRGTGGGTDDRYRPATYPVLHFFGDTLPYIACCLLSNDEESCARYFSLRPHRRGSNSPNSWGGTWGDPHFTTLDGSSYTFNGYGEYTYVAIASSSIPVNGPLNPDATNLVFNAQVRTSPLTFPNETSSNTATVIRGLSAKSNDPQAREISITISQREFLVVRRGNETLDLNAASDDSVATNASVVLYFPDMTLERNRTSGVLTLSWFVGVSIQINPISVSAAASNALILNIGISVAGLHQGRTFGLLGSYDNDRTNDLRTRDGNVIGLATALTLEQIHRQFGQTWAITPDRSLFYYESSSSASFYAEQNRIFTPLFSSPEPPTARINATMAACNIGSSLSNNRSAWSVSQRTCYYDIAITNDLSIGRASRAAADAVVQINNDQRSPPEFNSSLPLILQANQSTLLNISFTATSLYMSQISYTLVRGPSGATFNGKTGFFQWLLTPSAANNSVIRVRASDTQNNLVSTHELTVRIIASPPSHASRMIAMPIFMLLNLLAAVASRQ